MLTKDQLRRIIDQLCSPRFAQERDCVLEGVHCVRVGRNQVWKATGNSRSLYITCCRSQEDLARRLFGLEIAGRLAHQHPWIAAPRIEDVFAPERVLAVREMPGQSVDRLLTCAYRVDKNPFRRSEALAYFRRAVTAVLHFLNALHHEPVPANEPLWDHGPEGLLLRIRQHIRHLAEKLELMHLVDVPWPTFGSPVRRAIVIGDPSLGNFIFDGSRIACVDFEDIGVGEPRRDYIILADSLNRIFAQWHYSSDDVDRLVPLPAGDERLTVIYKSELKLLRLRSQLECQVSAN